MYFLKKNKYFSGCRILPKEVVALLMLELFVRVAVNLQPKLGCNRHAVNETH